MSVQQGVDRDLLIMWRAERDRAEAALRPKLEPTRLVDETKITELLNAVVAQ